MAGQPPAPGWVQYGDPNNPGWAPPDSPWAQGAQGTASQPTPQAAPAPNSTSAGGGAAAAPVPLASDPSQIKTPFYTAMSQILSQPLTVSPDDPLVRDPLNAARAQDTRTLANQRQQLAEQAQAEGFTDTGGFDSRARALASNMGIRESGLAASLTQNAQQQRMSQIMTALALGQGIMSDADRNQLQRELAQLDAGLRQQEITNELTTTTRGQDISQQESAAERALRQMLGEDQLSFDYSQLGQQDQQFFANLSSEDQYRAGLLNQAAVEAALRPDGGG